MVNIKSNGSSFILAVASLEHRLSNPDTSKVIIENCDGVFLYLMDMVTCDFLLLNVLVITPS
jgi:hypothetical protein